MRTTPCRLLALLLVSVAVPACGGSETKADTNSSSDRGTGSTSGSGSAMNDGSGGDDGSGGSGTGAATGSGGDAPSGGGSTGGADGGATSTGGSGTTGGGPGEPAVESGFSSLEGWSVAPKSGLIPGATATPVDDTDAADGKAIALVVPGNAGLTSSDYVGPGAHAIEIVADGEARLYGRYEFDAKFPVCGPDEDLVSGLFTYFNDGSDVDGDGVSDNSEIDIEHLCGDPQILWLTVWTDYRGDPEAFFRTSRMINMRTGAYEQTPLAGSSWGGLTPQGTLDGVSVENFPQTDTYYTLGFEWREESVRYFMIQDGQEIDLWLLEGKEYVPQRPAELLINLWHPGSHWSKGGAADYPASDATLLIDAVRVWD